MPKRRIIRKHQKKQEDQKPMESEHEEDSFVEDDGSLETLDANPKERKRRRVFINQIIPITTLVIFPREKHIPQHINRIHWIEEHAPSYCNTSSFDSSLQESNANELVTIKRSQLFLLRNISRRSKFQYDSTLLHNRDQFPQYLKHYKLIPERTDEICEKPKQFQQDRNKIGKDLFDLLVEFGFTADAKAFNVGAKVAPRSWDVGTWTYSMLTDQLHKYSLRVSGSKQEKMLRLLQYMKRMKIKPGHPIRLRRLNSLLSYKLSVVKKNQDDIETEENAKEESDDEDPVKEEKIEPPNLFSDFMTKLQTTSSQEANVLKECIQYVFEKFYRYRFKNSQLYCQYVIFYLSELSKLENIGEVLPNLITTFEIAWNEKEEEKKNLNLIFNEKVSRVKLLEFLLENFRLSESKLLSIRNMLLSFTKYEKSECEKLYKVMRKEELSEGIIFCCNQHFTFLFVTDVASNLS